MSRILGKLDPHLFFVTMTLMGLGLVQVYSTSFMFASESLSDGLFFFKRQLLFTVISLVALIVVSIIPFRFYVKYSTLHNLSNRDQVDFITILRD
jgi:cell division protein FtsW